TQNWKLTLYPTQHLYRRTVHQNLGHGIGPDQPVHRVVRLIRDIPQTIAIEIPAQVVTPVVAASLEGPLLLAQRHVLDLGLVTDKGVAVELVILGAGSHVNTDLGMG